MLSARLPEVDQSVWIETLLGVAAQATNILNQIRDAMLEPYPRKSAPTFYQRASRLAVRTRQATLPVSDHEGRASGGHVQGRAGRSKEFTLGETLTWIRFTKERVKRPEGKRGRIVTIANFKGGVAKTTTAVSAAQALTLLGRRVLVIRLRPARHDNPALWLGARR